MYFKIISEEDEEFETFGFAYLYTLVECVF